MRSKFRTVVLVLVGALALSAVASVSASAALPELVNSKGAELVKKKFTGEVKSGTGTGVVGLEVPGFGSEHDCSKLSVAGEVKGTKGGEATLTLTCAAACHTKGAKENEIKLPVSASLVWLSKAKESIALMLSLPGVVDLEGFCWGRVASPHLFEWSGSLLIPVGKRNELATEYHFTPKQKDGIQEPDEYENETGEKVKARLETTYLVYGEGWKDLPMGFGSEFPIKFEEEAEFKA